MNALYEGGLYGAWVVEKERIRADFIAKTSPAIEEPKAELPVKRQRKGLVRERFYRSAEWLSVRDEVFRRDGKVCAVCGATHQLNIDHILPRSRFPDLALNPKNLRVLCWPCNKKKNTKIEVDPSVVLAMI
jgi:hypothetical protein